MLTSEPLFEFLAEYPKGICMRTNLYTTLFLLTVPLTHVLFADDGGDSVVFSRPVLSISQEGTRIVKGGGYIRPGEGLNDIWLFPSSGFVDFQAKKNERLGLEVMVAATYFSAAYSTNFAINYTRNIAVSLPRLDASYVFGDPVHPSLRVDVGIFNYKYNEYSRNLGEYMFRTWAYPGIIQTGNAFGYVGNSSATVTGLKLSQSLGMFSHEFIASIETEMTPIYNLNLTYMAKFNYHDMLKVGGGVQIARIISDFDPPQTRIYYFEINGVGYPYDDGVHGTTPTVGANYYSTIQQGLREKLNITGISPADSIALNNMCNTSSSGCEPQGAKTSISSADSARFRSEFAQAIRSYSVIDSVYKLAPSNRPKMHELTAKAIKPVFYFSFDPKRLIHSNIFGPKDLVIYGEAAILGTQNYPVYYKDIWQRIPMMVGFNIPTFKALDVLSVEAEYYGSRWLPTYDFPPQNYNMVPAPFVQAVTDYYPADWDKDNWKWSIYAERTLIRGVTLSAQAASDHARSWDWLYSGKTPWEMYTTPSQWYWAMKLGIKI